MDSLSPASAGSPPGTANAASSAPKIRRRNRIITSCLECRRRKLKCDRSHPCNHCVRAKRDCIFLAPSLDANSKNKLNQFKESVDSLEKNLGRDEDGIFSEWNVSAHSKPDAGVEKSSSSRSREPVPTDEQGLEPSPLALADIIYDDEADDLMDDLGIRLGKVRVTERIGGFIRPRFAEELSDTVRMNPALQMPSVISQAEEDAARMSPPGLPDSNKTYMQPSAEYIAPGLGIPFAFSSTEELTLLSFLPSQDFADRLLERYWVAVHPIARILHQASFERQYKQFWNDISNGFEPPSTNQALIFAVLLAASVSLEEEDAQATFGCARSEMIRTFRTGCEYALSKSNLLRTTKTTTLQAFVLYLIPLCRGEVSRAHAALVSMAIRLAECAGLHRDGTHFGLTPIETHVRRLIWYQLCFLDIRVCSSVGPRPSIREGEYDTKLPLNVDERELESLVPPTQDTARFTELTLSIIRFEISDLSRKIWVGRPKVEKGEQSLTDLLRLVEEFRDRATRKWVPLINEADPLHAFASLLIQFGVHFMRVSILHRYVVSTPQEVPERLTRLVWASGSRQLDICIEWQTSPRFKDFRWYLGAYQQWHIALLFVPLIVMAKKPEPELDRVWTALDYVFEFPANLSREEKIRIAFWIARSRLDELQKQRRHRLPTSLEQRLGGVTRNTSTPTEQRRRSSSSQTLLTPFTSNNQARSPVQQLRNDWLGAPANPANPLKPAASAVKEFNFNGSPQIYPSPSDTGLDQAYQNAPRSGMAQPLDGVDWDDFDRLFPADNGLTFFDQQVMAQSSGGLKMESMADMPAMIEFPTPPWNLSSSHNNNQFNQ